MIPLSDDTEIKNILDRINSDEPCFGLVADLDISLYNPAQLMCVSQGRGDDFEYGNIDDLDPEKYMQMISKSR